MITLAPKLKVPLAVNPVPEVVVAPVTTQVADSIGLEQLSEALIGFIVTAAVQLPLVPTVTLAGHTTTGVVLSWTVIWQVAVAVFPLASVMVNT